MAILSDAAIKELESLGIKKDPMLKNWSIGGKGNLFYDFSNNIFLAPLPEQKSDKNIRLVAYCFSKISADLVFDKMVSRIEPLSRQKVKDLAILRKIHSEFEKASISVEGISQERTDGEVPRGPVQVREDKIPL